jgi:hypothetical protein
MPLSPPRVAVTMLRLASSPFVDRRHTEKAAMPRSVATFLMFEGVAEKAMNFYVSLFQGSQIKQIER